MRILFLSRWFPLPADNGSKLRIYNLLHGLSQHHDVTLLSFADQPNIDLAGSESRSLYRDVHVIPWRAFDPGSLRGRLGFFNFAPRFLADTYSAQMEALILDAISRNKYDLIIASQLSMAAYYSSFQGLPALFEEIELGLFHDNAVYSESPTKRIRLGLTWFKLRKYLERVLGAFCSSTVVSEQERQLFLASFPNSQTQVNVIPNCIAFKDYQGPRVEPVPNQLVFTGSFRYSANYDAMQWFVSEVFPRILSRLPETRLVITGDTADLPLPPVPNVTRTGYVEDVKPLIASSRVSIAPLLIGGGTRLKILEAMAMGTPVVSTSKGAEGLDSIPDEHLLLADSPAEFAEQVIRVLKDNTLHEKLSAKARELVKGKYNWEVVIPHFLDLVESAAS
jgi:glycosyltransferase involved in cell wall biosynthesis